MSDISSLLSKLKDEGKKFSSFSLIDQELTLDLFTQLQYDKPEKIDSEFPDNNGDKAVFTSKEVYYLLPKSGDMIEINSESEFNTIADAKVSYEDLEVVVVVKTENTTGESEVESHMTVVVYK